MRGGFLGDQFDAFRAGDPINNVPDVSTPIDDNRYSDRLESLSVLERCFAAGRSRLAESTLHADTVRRARQMMTSEQIKAFNVWRRAGGYSCRLWRHSIWSRLLGGTAADRAGRALCGSDAGRLGHACR